VSIRFEREFGEEIVGEEIWIKIGEEIVGEEIEINGRVWGKEDEVGEVIGIIGRVWGKEEEVGEEIRIIGRVGEHFGEEFGIIGRVWGKENDLEGVLEGKESVLGCNEGDLGVKGGVLDEKMMRSCDSDSGVT